MIIRAWVQTVRVMDEQAVILLFVFKWWKCKMELIRAWSCYLNWTGPSLGRAYNKDRKKYSLKLNPFIKEKNSCCYLTKQVFALNFKNLGYLLYTPEETLRLKPALSPYTHFIGAV